MAEIDFYFVDDEIRDLVEFVLAGGGRLVPNGKYPTPRHIELTDVHEVMERKDRIGQFFILHPSYSTSPLKMVDIQRPGHAREYIIMPRHGGPSIDLYCGRVKGDGPKPYMVASFLAYYPTYWNDELEVKEKTPDALKRFYASLTKRIKSGSRMLKTETRSYYVGRAAQQLVADGMGLSGYDM